MGLAIVKCEYCGKEIASEAGLLQHCRDKHLEEKPPEMQTGREDGGGRKGSRRSLRRRKSHTRLYLALAVIVVLSGAGIYALSNSLAHPSGPNGALPFPCSSGTIAEHVHPWLTIVINGQNMTIPADIGIVNGGGCLEPLHTHDASGTIHIEASSTATQYTLNDFFTIWSATYGSVTIAGTQHPIIFNSTDILGFKADATHKVILLVDGKPSSEYGSLVLDSLDYCSAATTGPPCSPTAVGTPYWNGQEYPYGTGHTIVIEYTASG